MVLIHGCPLNGHSWEKQEPRLPGLIQDLEFVTVEESPHHVAWTHPDVVTPALLRFLGD